MHTRGIAAVIVVLTLIPVFSVAQVTNSTEVPRTPWGVPDLQGVWDFRTLTPLERPEEFTGKKLLTAEEAAIIEQRDAEVLSLIHI